MTLDWMFQTHLRSSRLPTRALTMKKTWMHRRPSLGGLSVSETEGRHNMVNRA